MNRLTSVFSVAFLLSGIFSSTIFAQDKLIPQQLSEQGPNFNTFFTSNGKLFSMNEDGILYSFKSDFSVGSKVKLGTLGDPATTRLLGIHTVGETASLIIANVNSAASTFKDMKVYRNTVGEQTLKPGKQAELGTYERTYTLSTYKGGDRNDAIVANYGADWLESEDHSKMVLMVPTNMRFSGLLNLNFYDDAQKVVFAQTIKLVGGNLNENIIDQLVSNAGDYYMIYGNIGGAGVKDATLYYIDHKTKEVTTKPLLLPCKNYNALYLKEDLSGNINLIGTYNNLKSAAQNFKAEGFFVAQLNDKAEAINYKSIPFNGSKVKGLDEATSTLENLVIRDVKYNADKSFTIFSQYLFTTKEVNGTALNANDLITFSLDKKLQFKWIEAIPRTLKGTMDNKSSVVFSTFETDQAYYLVYLNGLSSGIVDLTKESNKTGIFVSKISKTSGTLDAPHKCFDFSTDSDENSKWQFNLLNVIQLNTNELGFPLAKENLKTHTIQSYLQKISL